SLLGVRSQGVSIAGVNDEHRKQLGRLRGAHVSTHEMRPAAGELVPALASSVGACRLAFDLALYGPRQDVGEDERRFCMPMRFRNASWRICDFLSNQRFAGNIRDDMLELRRDDFARALG